jgi:hypothetical protein
MNIRHPVYGEGTLVTLDPVTGIAHVRFDNPPGMHSAHSALVPVVEMRMVDGKLVPVYLAAGAYAG